MLPWILVLFVASFFVLSAIGKCLCDLLSIVGVQHIFSGILWSWLLSIPSWLLSEYALAVYPVARLFTRLSGSREPGMSLSLALVYVGKIGLALNPLITAGNLEMIVLNGIIFAVSTGLFINAIHEFTSTARRCGGKWGLKK